MKVITWLRALFRRASAESDLQREIEFHLQMEAQANERAGMNPEEARRTAVRTFGGVEPAKEACRDSWGARLIDNLWQDLSHAGRGLRRNIGFTAVIVVTLALGIGAAAAIFGISEHVLFLTDKFPADVYVVCTRDHRIQFSPQLHDYVTRGYEHSSCIAASAKLAPFPGNVAVNGQPVSSGWVGVSPNFFPMLGIAPAIGRNFLPGEDREGANSVVIISDRMWHSVFHGDADVLGRKVSVGPDVCVIVGVLKPDQQLPGNAYADFFRPLTYRVNPNQPWAPQLGMIVKLRPGFTPEQAIAALNGIELHVPPGIFLDGKIRATLVSLPEYSSASARSNVFWVLLAAVGFLYAIACLNSSNLMLVRMLGHRRELSIRLALGAGRWRVVRLLVAESLLVAVLGTVGGILVGNWLLPVLLRLLGSGEVYGASPAWWSFDWAQLDAFQIAVLVLLTVTTSLAIVVVPAARVLRSQISPSLKDGGAALGESRWLSRFRSSLVILQTSFAVVLLAGAMLMIRTFENFEQVDLGYDGTHRLKIQLGFPPTYPQNWESRLAKLHDIQALLERVPGVDSAGFGNDVMLPGYFVGTHTVQGAEGASVKAMIRCYSTGFETLSGMRLIRGRPLHLIRGNEILVSEALARACWPGMDPIGRVMHPFGDSPGFGQDWKGWVVVGVVADMRAGVRSAPSMLFYSDEGWDPINYNTFIVKLAGSYDTAINGLLRRTLYAFDPQLAVNYITPLDQLRDTYLRAEKLTDSVLRVLAGLAAFLTVVGLFSILAYTVDVRRNEFGVRLALGATGADLANLVLRRGMSLAITGLVIGLASAFWLTRFVQALLFNTSPEDPVVLAAVAITLIGAAALACAIPSYRATKVDVTRLLRAE